MTAALWAVVDATATAGELHGDLPDPSRRLVRVSRPTRAALVLGSAQQEHDGVSARAGALGLDVVRRRSGGGAVLLGPRAQVWLDVCLPRGDVLWDDDVGRAGRWLGEAFVAALGLGEVHAGAMVRTALSDRICFAGLGPGEVTVGAAKLVGVSQRRTRAGAVFQCTVPLRWEPTPLVEVFALGAEDAATVATCGMALPLAHDDVVSAVVAALP